MAQKSGFGTEIFGTQMVKINDTEWSCDHLTILKRRRTPCGRDVTFEIEPHDEFS